MFDSHQGVRYFAFIPSDLKQRGEVTPSVHHSDDLDGIKRAIVGVGPYLIENHIGRFDQHPSGSEYFRVTLAQTRVLDQQFRLTAKLAKYRSALRGCSFPISIRMLFISARAFGVQRSLTGMGSGRRYFLACFIQHRIKIHFDRGATSLAFFPHRT